MENIYKSINLNKELNSYYKKFKLNKYKFNWVSFLLLILALVFLPFAIKVNRLFYIVVIVFLVVAIFINRKFSLKKKMTYCNFIE